MSEIVTKDSIRIDQTPKQGQERSIVVAVKSAGRADAIDLRQYTEGREFSKEGVWMNLEVAQQVHQALGQMLSAAGVTTAAAGRKATPKPKAKAPARKATARR